MLAQDIYSTEAGRGVLPMAAELYLHAFRRGLLALPESERAGIVDEVRAQIAGHAALGEAGLEKLLARLGPPERLARQFTFSFELADSVNRSNPWRLLLVVLASATVDLWALAGAFAALVFYIVGGAFAMIALLKPVLPQFVGAWVSDAGGFTMGVQLAHRGREIMGYGIIPVSVALAVGCLVAGNTLLRGCGRRLMRSARRWTGRGAEV